MSELKSEFKKLCLKLHLDAEGIMVLKQIVGERNKISHPSDLKY